MTINTEPVELAELVVTASAKGGEPRGLVQVDGELVTGWTAFDTEENEFTAPDSFRVTFAMSDLPPGKDADWWSRAEKAEVELFAGRTSAENYTTGDLSSIFVGQVDDVDADWVGRTITVSGRDLTAPLIDTKTSEKHVNLTASEVAEKLAGKYGLDPVVEATTTKVGKFYKTDQVDLQEERTEWDLLTWLAREEGFMVYVRGRELHFERARDAETAHAYEVTREALQGAVEAGNYVNLNTSRNLGLSGEIKVTVKSWNSKQKKAFTKTATKPGKGGGAAQEFSYTIPGLTSDQTQERARSILADLSKHGARLNFTGPVEVGLHIADIIRLSGTGTAWDQVYYPERISRQMSLQGYEWTVDAKNKPPEADPDL